MKSVGVIKLITNYAINMSRFKDTSIDIFRENFRTTTGFGAIRKLSNMLNQVKYLTHLFIEEPELNLFPKHQKELIFFLASKFNNKALTEKRFALSTHIPYILTSLNCLLQAGKISEAEKIDQWQLKEIIKKEYWLSPKDFCAFEVKDGEVKNLINDKTGLILAEAIDGVSDEINGTFGDLLDLEYPND